MSTPSMNCCNNTNQHHLHRKQNTFGTNRQSVCAECVLLNRWEKKNWHYSTNNNSCTKVEFCTVKWCAVDTKCIIRMQWNSSVCWVLPNTVSDKQNWIRMNNELNPHVHFLCRPNCDCYPCCLYRHCSKATPDNMAKLWLQSRDFKMPF